MIIVEKSFATRIAVAVLPAPPVGDDIDMVGNTLHSPPVTVMLETDQLERVAIAVGNTLHSPPVSVTRGVPLYHDPPSVIITVKFVPVRVAVAFVSLRPVPDVIF